MVRALEWFLQWKMIQRQKYFGGAMVGNDVEKLLRSLDTVEGEMGLWDFLRKEAMDMDHEEAIREKLSACVHGSCSVSFNSCDLRVAGVNSAMVEKLISKIKPTWAQYEVLHHECRKNRLLTDAEVDTLCAAAVGVVKSFREAYPLTNVEPKLHIIEAYVPAFVKKWRCAGPFFEDAVEHYHATDNELNRRFCCLHGEAKAQSKHNALEIMRRTDIQQLLGEFHKSRKRKRT
jgi:hypothetical protein